MAKQPLKLAALLKDEAAQPGSPAATSVNLNVLQDAQLPIRDPKRRLQWIAAALAAVVAVGVLSGVLWEMRDAMPTKTAPGPKAKTDQKAKPGQKETPAEKPDPSAYSKPVQELMQYADELRSGKTQFSAGISGEEAASQLRYSRLFASAYEEMILFSKASGTDKPRPRIGEIIAGFDKIVREEQTIDQLLARGERHATAIAYLRALQNGDVVFPGPRAIAPAPPILLIQLMSAYPEVSLDINDPVFASIYRDAREFAASRMMSAGELFAHEVIGEFRREIVASAAAVRDNSDPTECEQGTGLGYAESMVATCKRLRLSLPASKAVSELASRQLALECRNIAAIRLRADLVAMQNEDVTGFCSRIADRIRKREISFIEIVD